MAFARFINRVPVKRYTLIHISMWMVGYAILVMLTHLTALTAAPEQQLSIKASILIALFLGFFSGLSSAIVDQISEKPFFHRQALWVVFVLKASVSLAVFIVLISIVRHGIYPMLARRLYLGKELASHQQSWDYFFLLLLIYNMFIGMVISFINFVHNKFGPGVLMPLLLGRFRSPKEEERIFLFMDLKSSTAIAEHLGHLKYSAFIRDSFMDINAVLSECSAQIYQYVGDEIVLTWKVHEGLKEMSCIKFFFACQNRFAARSSHYERHYGQTPNFKAGLHMGMVTAVEVGNVKRDIAYHGDTLNTAARIQSVCNEFGKSCLLSEKMLVHLNGTEQYHIENLGSIMLKGKSKPVGIASIQVRMN
jgi:adenylate cyclase